MEQKCQRKPTDDLLVGRWAHVLDEHGGVDRQCRILRASGEAAYLVQWYEWISGGPSTMNIVPIEEIGSGKWVLYESSEDMHAAYEARMKP